MRRLLRNVWFVVTDAWRSRGRRVRVDDSVARTIKESSHVGGGGSAGAAGFAPRSPQIEQMVAGADDYVKSFEEGS